MKIACTNARAYVRTGKKKRRLKVGKEYTSLERSNYVWGSVAGHTDAEPALAFDPEVTSASVRARILTGTAPIDTTLVNVSKLDAGTAKRKENKEKLEAAAKKQQEKRTAEKVRLAARTPEQVAEEKRSKKEKQEKQKRERKEKLAEVAASLPEGRSGQGRVRSMSSQSLHAQFAFCDKQIPNWNRKK